MQTFTVGINDAELNGIESKKWRLGVYRGFVVRAVEA